MQESTLSWHKVLRLQKDKKTLVKYQTCHRWHVKGYCQKPSIPWRQGKHLAPLAMFPLTQCEHQINIFLALCLRTLLYHGPAIPCVTLDTHFGPCVQITEYVDIIMFSLDSKKHFCHIGKSNCKICVLLSCHNYLEAYWFGGKSQIFLLVFPHPI